MIPEDLIVKGLGFLNRRRHIELGLMRLTVPNLYNSANGPDEVVKSEMGRGGYFVQQQEDMRTNRRFIYQQEKVEL